MVDFLNLYCFLFLTKQRNVFSETEKYRIFKKNTLFEIIIERQYKLKKNTILNKKHKKLLCLLNKII